MANQHACSYITNQVDSKLITEDGSSIGFGVPTIKSQSKLPSIKANLLSTNKSSFVESNVTKSDNSITQNITINPTSDNVTLMIPFKLENEESLKIVKDEDGNFAGNIVDKEGNSVAILLTPVVGEGVKIDGTVVDGNLLKVDLKTSNPNKPTSIAITAAATSYSSYFQSGTWITRDGMLSLSLTHKPFLFDAFTLPEIEAKRSDSWSKVVNVHSSSPNWKKPAGLKDQYDCHYDTIANLKNPYNLEPSRPYVGYKKTVLAACNP